MGKHLIRNFPLELPQSPWPLLQPTPEDRQYKPILESPRARRARQRRESLRPLYLDLRTATLKGTLLGLFSFGALFGILSTLPFWLEGWHWAFALGGALVLILLLGVDLTLFVLAIGTLVLSLGTIIAQPLTLLLFIGGGVIVRDTIELFPRKSF